MIFEFLNFKVKIKAVVVRSARYGGRFSDSVKTDVATSHWLHSFSLSALSETRVTNSYLFPVTRNITVCSVRAKQRQS